MPVQVQLIASLLRSNEATVKRSICKAQGFNENNPNPQTTVCVYKTLTHRRLSLDYSNTNRDSVMTQKLI